MSKNRTNQNIKFRIIFIVLNVLIITAILVIGFYTNKNIENDIIKDKKEMLSSLIKYKLTIKLYDDSTNSINYSANDMILDTIRNDKNKNLDYLNLKFKEIEKDYLILLNENFTNKVKKTKENQKFGNYYLASDKWFNDEATSFIKSLNIDKLIENGYILNNEKFIIASSLKDFNGNTQGYHILGENSNILLNTIKIAKKVTYTYVAITVLFVLLLLIFILIFFKYNVISKLKDFNNTLLEDSEAESDSSLDSKSNNDTEQKPNPSKITCVSEGHDSELLNELHDVEHELISIKYEHNIFNTYMITSETDKRGFITYVSKPFIDISGYTKDELIGKNHNMVRHPDTPSETFKEVWETIKAKKIWRGEIKNLKKDGSIYWVISIIFPKLDYNDEITGYKSMRIDITNSKKLEESVKKVLLKKPTA